MAKNKSQVLANLKGINSEITKFDGNQGKQLESSRPTSNIMKNLKLYNKVQESIRHKKWLSTSMMQKRDSERTHSDRKTKIKCQIMK